MKLLWKTFDHRVDELVNNTLDLREVKFLDPLGVVGLLCVSEEVSFQRVRRPENQACDSYLLSLNFYSELGSEEASQVEKTEHGRQTTRDLDRLSASTTPEDFYNSVYSWLKQNNFHILHDEYEALTSVAEAFSNFRDHANTDTAYYLGQLYPNRGDLEIAFADAGIGIRGSLFLALDAQSLPDDNEELLRRTLIQGISSRKEGGGHGFRHMLDTVELCGGLLSVASGSAQAWKEEGQDVRTVSTGYPFSGTRVFFQLPIERGH